MSTAPSPDVALRQGLPYWWASLRSMMRFEFGGLRQWAPMMVVIQALMGAGMAMTYGFFYPDLTPARALFITTGAPVLALFPIGFVMVPGSVQQQRIDGTFDYVWSLPTPRSAQAAATFLLFTLLALPGTLLALLAAAWRYDVDLSVSLLVVPAALLCSLMSVSVGYGMALAIENTMIVNVISNALVFMVLLFSPIAYPIEQLPDWFASVHRVLPFWHMATLIRAGLTDGVVNGVAGSFAVLAAWTAAGMAATAWVIARRR